MEDNKKDEQKMYEMWMESALKRQASLLERISEHHFKIKVLKKDLKDIEEESSQTAQAVMGTREQALGYALEEKDIIEKKLNSEKEWFSLQADKIQSQLDANDAAEEGNKKSAKWLKIKEAQLERMKEAGKLKSKALQDLDEEVAELGKQKKLQTDIDKVTGSIAFKMGLNVKSSDSILGKSFGTMRNLVNTAKQAGGWKEATKAVANSMADVFSITNLVSAGIGAIFKASLEFVWESSKALSQFNATSGTAGEMAKSVAGAMNLAAGVDIAEASSAAAGLAGSYSELTSTTGEAQTALINTAAELEKVGISASTTGKNLTILTKAFGMSEKAAAADLEGLATAAAGLGKVPAKLSEEFASAAGSLAAQGDKMKKVFFGLQAQAKETGIEFSKLMGVAEKFDTFDSAADSVGSLNAILGGDYLNSIEMMAMSEEERIDAVKRAISMQGKSFDQMERFERKAIAKNLGMDTAELAMMMNANSAESKAAAEAAEKEANQKKKYNKMINMTVDLLTQLKNTFSEIFRDPKVIGAITGVLRDFFEAIQENKPMIIKAVRQLGSVMGALISAAGWLIDATDGLIVVFLFLASPILQLIKVFKWLFRTMDKDGNKVVSKWSKMWKYLGEKMPNFAKFFKKVATKIGDAVLRIRLAFISLQEIIEKRVKKISKTFKDILNFFKGPIKELPTKLRKGFGIAIETVTKFGDGMWKGFKRMGKNVVEFLTKLPQKMIKKITAWGPKLMRVFKKITLKLLAKLGLVFDFAYILNTLLPDNVLGEGDLSRKIAAIPVAIIQFFTLGLLEELTGNDQIYKDILDWADSLFTSVIDWFEGMASGDSWYSWIFKFFNNIVHVFAIGASLLVDGLAYVGKFIGNFFAGLFGGDDEGMFKAIGDSLSYFFFEQIPDFFLGGFKKAVQGVKDFLGIASPSALFSQIGDFIVGGLKGALEYGMKTVLGPIMDFVIKFMDRIVSAAEAFKSIAANISLIVTAFKAMPLSKVSGLASGVERVYHAAAEVKNADAPVRVIKEAARYQKELASNKELLDPLVEILKATNSSTGGGSGGGAPEKIVLELDGRVLRDFIYKTGDDKLARYA